MENMSFIIYFIYSFFLNLLIYNSLIILCYKMNLKKKVFNFHIFKNYLNLFIYYFFQIFLMVIKLLNFIGYNFH